MYVQLPSLNNGEEGRKEANAHHIQNQYSLLSFSADITQWC